MLRFLFKDIPYRIHISRRLILTSLALVALGVAGAQIVDPAGNRFADPQAFIALIWVWGLILVMNAIVFPSGWIDALFASLALAILLVPSPLFFDYLAGASKIAQPMAPGTAVLLAIGLWYTLFSFLVIGFCRLGPMIRMGRQKIYSTLHSAMPPDDLRRAISPAPNVENDVRRCGPVDWTGRFTVTFIAVEPDPVGFRLRENTHSFQARIVHEDDTYKVTEYFVDLNDQTTASRVEEWFEPTGTGTDYRMQEIHDHFDLPAALGFWLCDFGADHTRALLDTAAGRHSPAIFTKPRRTAMTSLARLFSWRRAPT